MNEATLLLFPSQRRVEKETELRENPRFPVKEYSRGLRSNTVT